MSIEPILRRISLFDSVEDNALPELAQSLETIRLDAGRILFYENDPGDCFYIIVEGNLEIIKAFGSTEESLLKDWGPGNFLGEMSMFDLEGRRSATVRAKTPATLLKMNHASFRALLHRQPDLAFEVTRQLSLRLRNTDNAIIDGLQEKNRQVASAYAELSEAYT
jgi:CRP-like cAMP-binding protein